MLEELALDFEPAAAIALDAEHLAIDDAPYPRAALTERANPDLLPQFEAKLADRLFGGPVLLNPDLEAGKSRVWKMIFEAHHPRAIGQFANVHDLYGIGDVQLSQHVGRKTPQLKSFNSYHVLFCSRAGVHG